MVIPVRLATVLVTQRYLFCSPCTFGPFACWTGFREANKLRVQYILHNHIYIYISIFVACLCVESLCLQPSFCDHPAATRDVSVHFCRRKEVRPEDFDDNERLPKEAKSEGLKSRSSLVLSATSASWTYVFCFLVVGSRNYMLRVFVLLVCLCLRGK